MKPPPFAYHRPATVGDAVSTLAEFGDEAKILAGGQSLIPMLNMRLTAPSHLIDINRVTDFPGIRVEGGTVEIGALVRQREAEISEHVERACPLLRQALSVVAHRAIRSRGTVVGSIVHADPAAELPAVFELLGESVSAVGPQGRRTIAADDFYNGYFETTLAADEVVTAIRLRCVEPGEGTAFTEVTRRHGDFAICAAAACVSRGRVRVAVAGVDAVPRAFDATGLLNGDGAAVLNEISESIEPESDIHASSDYRRHLARELASQVVIMAAERSSRAGIDKRGD